MHAVSYIRLFGPEAKSVKIQPFEGHMHASVESTTGEALARMKRCLLTHEEVKATTSQRDLALQTVSNDSLVLCALQHVRAEQAQSLQALREDMTRMMSQLRTEFDCVVSELRAEADRVRAAADATIASVREEAVRDRELSDAAIAILRLELQQAQATLQNVRANQGRHESLLDGTTRRSPLVAMLD
jgi:hypothetical protein